MPLRLLPPTVINQIAAGEVIERPGSAVKELVENSIDAGAKKIEIAIHNGGRNYISVKDDGIGLDTNELELCLERHATSKLDDEDLFNISSFGFRGEALPSIGSVSRLQITSRKSGSDEAYSIAIEGGEKMEVAPASIKQGTKIEVRDLFFATPARLKFLKSERSETQFTKDIIIRLAMVNPDVEFILRNENTTLLHVKRNQGDFFDSSLKRLSEILGKDFEANALPVNFQRDELSLKGFACVPTYNKGMANSQYLFVNGRPVKDKLLLGAIRVAYQDFLARNRYPVIVLFIDITPREVDVNVHPTKAEVRFREANMVKSAIISALRDVISGAGHRASTTVAADMVKSFKPGATPARATSNIRSFNHRPSYSNIKANFPTYVPEFATDTPDEAVSTSELREPVKEFDLSPPKQEPVNTNPQLFTATDNIASVKVNDNTENDQIGHPLGLAKAQLHETYIIAQSDNGLVIVDQHAAHERLVYEKMKQQMANSNVKVQRLLIPEVVEIDESAVNLLVDKIPDLAKFGLALERFGDKAVIVREIPAILEKTNVESLVRDIANDLLEYGEILSMQEAIEHICGTIACHNSIRSGRTLNSQEMNAILRQMEDTAHSGQCNHGRPTYVKLDLKDIEKLFGRT